MLVTTSTHLEGYRVVEQKGLVHGIIVRTPTIGQGIFGSLGSVFGGKNQAYTEMCEQGRDDAYQKMIEHAENLGGNAIIGVSFDASEVVVGATEVFCYGTAVVVEKTV
jgi:uncharacterized protein YbjQ (UPF0145 family)